MFVFSGLGALFVAAYLLVLRKRLKSFYAGIT
jgi:hypothetical protein